MTVTTQGQPITTVRKPVGSGGSAMSNVLQFNGLGLSGAAGGGMVGVVYSAQFSAFGGTAPYTFALAIGTLPAGVTLNTSTGLLSGPATAAATSTFTIRVTDSAASPATATSPTQTVVIAAAPAAPTIVTAPAINGTPQVGVATSFTSGTFGGGAGTTTIQWTLDGVAIAGATGATYTPVAGDATHALRVVQTVTNVSGTSGANASAAATVAAASTGASAPKFFVGPAAAYNTNTAALMAAATPLTGGANHGRAGTFSLTTSAGNYGWLAVESAQVGSGVRLFDGVGYGGWSGGGLAGNNTGASPDPTTVSTTFTDGNGVAWKLFRQDYVNANPSASTYTLS